MHLLDRLYNMHCLKQLLVRHASGWDIAERFIEFKEFSKQKMRKCSNGGGITDIADQKRQCYDNGANMAGKVNRVQVCIISKNPLVSHTLNLIGTHAVLAWPEIDSFVGFINQLYKLFGASLIDGSCSELFDLECVYRGNSSTGKAFARCDQCIRYPCQNRQPRQ